MILSVSNYLLQIIEDFQQKAIAKGSEDPQSNSILQKCEEYLPGQVKDEQWPNWNFCLVIYYLFFLLVSSGQSKKQPADSEAQASW